MQKILSYDNNRKEWVDVLRSLAMLFVIYGHLLSGYGHSEYFMITSPVKIPLFFAITGYVFNDYNGNCKSFFAGLVRKLIVPFLFFSVVLMPVKLFAAYRGLVSHTVKEVFVSFITGNELWYLPCCIVAEVLFFFVCKFYKKEKYLIFCSILLSVAGFLFSSFGILKIANINTAFIAQLFILIGYLFRCHEVWFRKNGRALVISGVTLYVLLCISSSVLYPSRSLDVHKNQYYSIPLNIALIIVGNFWLLTLFSSFKFKSKSLSFIGRNTLVFYVVHEYVVGAIGIAIGVLRISHRGSYLFEIIELIIVCLVCALLAVFCNRFLPFASGKRYQNHH